MKLCMIVFVSSCLLAIGGCIKGSTYEVASREGESLEQTSDLELAWAYGGYRDSLGNHERMRAEIERRKIFTAQELEQIDKKVVGVGDPLRVVYASWGSPSNVHTIQHEGGQGSVLCYDNRRVYLHNGRVSAISQ